LHWTLHKPGESGSHQIGLCRGLPERGRFGVDAGAARFGERGPSLLRGVKRVLLYGVSGGSFLSLFGGSNATDGIGGFGPAAPVGINHGGYGPGDSMPVRFVPSRVLLNAPRFHSGIGPGERAAIIRTDESVLTPGQMKAMGGGGISVRGDTHITIQGNADEKTVALLRQELAKRDAEFASNVVQTVKRAKQGRHL